MSPYETLGVEPSATRAEVAEAYKALVQIYHPDRYVGMAERVRAEAERKMKEVTEAYAAIKAGTAVRHVEATTPYQPVRQRRQWPKATTNEPEAAADAVGVVAEPLPEPPTKYAAGQWNAANRHWSWSDTRHTWVCGHGKDICGTCGSTPDVVAARSGVERPPHQWRKSAKDGAWVCVSHHKLDCQACGKPPTEASVIDLRASRAARAAAADGSGRGRARRRVAWS